MKAWIVRFASLYAFNVIVLFAIGLLLPSVSVGWAALWASVILTVAALWLKPLISKLFTGAARKSAHQRTGAGERVVRYGIVFLVELIMWVLVVILSGVHVGGFFWGWILPPVLLLIAWAIYDAVDDRVHKRASDLYDTVTGRRAAGAAGDEAVGGAAATAVRPELDDGLTPEQRTMLEDLGKS